MSCTNPIPWASLVDYWARDLDDEAASAIEDHLFGCADCTAVAARVSAVTEAVRSAISPVVSRQQLERLRARGARVLENAFAPGERRVVEFGRETDLLIHRLGGLDLSGADRVDVRITQESTGALVTAAEAVPFVPAEGAVLIACQRHYEALPHDTVMSVSIYATGKPPRTTSYTILHRFL
jgi:hypothetical protein